MDSAEAYIGSGGDRLDLGTASALSLFNFQTAAASGGQSAAILQAMTRLYDDATVRTGANALDDVVLSAGLAPLAEAVNTLANGEGAATVPIETLQSYLTYGGMNGASAANLFSNDGSTGNTGLNGFDTAITARATLALAAYQASQNFLGPTPPQLADASLNLLG